MPARQIGPATEKAKRMYVPRRPPEDDVGCRHIARIQIGCQFAIDFRDRHAPSARGLSAANSATICRRPGPEWPSASRPTVQGAMPRQTEVKQTLCADIDGFSLHAAVRVEANDRKRLERIVFQTPFFCPTALRIRQNRGNTAPDALESGRGRVRGSSISSPHYRQPICTFSDCSGACRSKSHVTGFSL